MTSDDTRGSQTLPSAVRPAYVSRPVRMLQDLLGHCSLDMTQAYVWVEWEELVEAVEAVDLLVLGGRSQAAR